MCTLYVHLYMIRKSQSIRIHVHVLYVHVHVLYVHVDIVIYGVNKARYARNGVLSVSIQLCLLSHGFIKKIVWGDRVWREHVHCGSTHFDSIIQYCSSCINNGGTQQISHHYIPAQFCV